MKNRIKNLLIGIILGLLLAGLLAAYQVSQNKPESYAVQENFGGPFTLTDHTGKKVTEKDFEGQWRLIYFGFTYCPAICPTELQKISSALKTLGSKAENIKPVFITVDPERDTVEVMKNYVELFHPRLTGLTGTNAQVEEAKKSYKIYSAKVKDETMSDYTVDHSSFIYLIDANDSLIRIFKTDDTAEDIVRTVKQVL